MSYSELLVTPAVEEPVTVAEAKDNSSVAASITAHDSKFARWIAAARRIIEERSNRQLVTATWRLTLDRFPPAGEPILLPRPPLQSVSSLKYYDSAGVQQTWNAASYTVSAAREPGRISPAYENTWPVARMQPDAIEVNFVAGYGAQADVPEDFKTCILMITDDWFNHRSGEGDVGPWINSLIEQFRFGDEMLCYEASQ